MTQWIVAALKAPPTPMPPAAAPVVLAPTAVSTSACALTDLDTTQQQLVLSLLSRPDVTATLLDQWGAYYDPTCPIVGQSLHSAAMDWNLEAMTRRLDETPPASGWRWTSTALS